MSTPSGTRRRCGRCPSCLRPQDKQACEVLKALRVQQGKPPSKRRKSGEEAAAEQAVGLPDLGSPLVEGGMLSPEAVSADNQQQQQQQSGGRRGGGRSTGLTPGGSKRFYYLTHQLMFTSQTEFARRQHLSNLVFLLRQATATRDWQRVAALVATLLASDRPENVSEQWMFRHPGSRARLAEALGAGWLLLQQYTGSLSYEQTRRYLKQWAAYQLAAPGREAILLELARHSRAQGHAIDAWDFLGSQQFSTVAAEGQRYALMAAIRADAWAQTMREAVEQLPAVAQLSSSPNKRRRGGPARGPAWQPWEYSAAVLARGGRLAKELLQEAADCCKKSLEQQPEASDVAQMLAQLQLAGGDASSASDTARRQRQQAPLDADAAGLLALLLVAQPAQESHALQQSQSQQYEQEQEQEQRQEQQREQQPVGAGLSPAAAAEAADCCCQLLAVDPSCHAAAATLLQLHAQQTLPVSVLTAGCCFYLEGQPPTWLPPLLELRVWQHLAATLVQAAAAVVEQQRRLKELQQRRQSLLPRSLHDLQLQQRRHKVGSSQVQERWQHLQELSAAAVKAQQQQQLAMQAYEQCCTLLEGRLWWRDAHLLPQPSTTVAAALEAGAASPAALLALAAINAFMHPLWQRCMVADWRASGYASGLHHLMQNLMTRHTIAALEQAGHRQEAVALRTAAKLCRKAAAAVASAAQAGSGSSAAVAALASVARQRADFWRAARRPWRPPAGWLPIPLGAVHPELGRITPLPSQWWACFPQVRRRQRPPPEQRQQLEGAVSGLVAASPAAATSLATPQMAAAAAAAQVAAVAGEHQQPQALRWVQQPGVRSILKGSQQQDPLHLAASQPQSQVGGFELARPGRRVQFQLPQPPTAAGQQEQQQGAVLMEIDAGSQQQQQQQQQQQASGAAAEEEAEDVGRHHSRRNSGGRRRLLPQVPRSLAEDDGDGGSGMAATEGGWRERLQQRRRSSQQQQAWKGG